jgi:tRNA-splicing ligase RtcB
MASKKKINTNDWLIGQGYKNHPQFTAIAKRAAQLAKESNGFDAIRQTIQAEFPMPAAPQRESGVMERPAPYTLFQGGNIQFDSATLDQFKQALSMRPVVGGAEMPDGHYGYGVPIGAVVATRGAIFPSYVGVDISCRMTATVLDISVNDFMRERKQVMDWMIASSKFGPQGYGRGELKEHAVMNDPLWKQLPYLRSLKDKAHSQLGTSGGGNHFFDAMVMTVVRPISWLPNAKVGEEYVVIVTHSGSRNVGKATEEYYDALAVTETQAKYSKVPKGYAWLDMDGAAGQEYVQAMLLMGQYAQANHHIIHDTFLAKSRLKSLAQVENQHNFAEILEDGTIIHRKGATPAGIGQFGIVPGSCLGTSFIVEGLGNPDSFNSSSHGAGRAKSRAKAKDDIRNMGRDVFERAMKKADILHFGIADDETSFAYKNPDEVMALQDGVVCNVVATMKPRIVVMGEEDRNEGK